MTLLKFSEKDILGIPKIDKQHKKIYSIVNELYELKDGKKKTIVKCFDELISKFKEHFETEENFIKENNAVSLFSHKLEHQRAFTKYSFYLESYKNSSDSFDEEILTSLKTWLNNHAEMKDNKLKKYAK